jgi:hypothetical protein
MRTSKCCDTTSMISVIVIRRIASDLPLSARCANPA